MRGKLSNTWGWSIVLGINLYLEMVCYAFCRRRPVQEGNGDGDGQCKSEKKIGKFFFLFRLVGIVALCSISKSTP